MSWDLWVLLKSMYFSIMVVSYREFMRLRDYHTCYIGPHTASSSKIL